MNDDIIGKETKLASELFRKTLALVDKPPLSEMDPNTMALAFAKAFVFEAIYAGRDQQEMHAMLDDIYAELTGQLGKLADKHGILRPKG